ncbi:MAG: hypothetical protein GDA43_02570 [Hormoscilla sp. SP5CHS1]|nr:hypothetical protein [Hormoscilla sp. SP12CHS1]MBC6452208.1 hypothetical protein [Hormoscilla sp. SP5CHS1]
MGFAVQEKAEKYNQQLQELKDQCRQKDLEVETVKGQKESLEGELKEQEASKSKLLAEVARLKLNTGTHYDGTSERPQHHVLTGEYKTLKEQHLEPRKLRSPPPKQPISNSPICAWNWNKKSRSGCFTIMLPWKTCGP